MTAGYSFFDIPFLYSFFFLIQEGFELSCLLEIVDTLSIVVMF